MRKNYRVTSNVMIILLLSFLQSCQWLNDDNDKVCNMIWPPDPACRDNDPDPAECEECLKAFFQTVQDHKGCSSDEDCHVLWGDCALSGFLPRLIAVNTDLEQNTLYDIIEDYYLMGCGDSIACLADPAAHDGAFCNSNRECEVNYVGTDGILN